MRNLLILSKFFCLTLFVFSFFSCEKSSKNSVPLVQTLSLENLPDGTVKITGLISPENKADVRSVGFCYGVIPNPTAEYNQVYSYKSNSSDNFFISTIEDLEVSQRLYFRAWAENNNGYGYGESIALDSLYIEPVTAPCNKETNRFSAGSFTRVLNSFQIQDMMDYKEITGSGSSGFVRIRLAKPAYTGIYETAGSAFGKKVNITFQDGYSPSVVSPGYKIYVNKIGNHYEITCCLAKYKISGIQNEIDFWCKIKTN
jgi:hypothetical protein